MSKFNSWLTLILMLLIVLFYIVARVSDSVTRYEYARAVTIEADGRARAAVIQAQAESRLHSAQAGATIAAVMLPYMVLGILGILGLATVVLGAIILYSPRLVRPPIIERQIIYLPAPGQRRAEFWQALSELPGTKFYDCYPHRPR